MLMLVCVRVQLADAFYVKEFEKAEKETEKQVEEVKVFWLRF